MKHPRSSPTNLVELSLMKSLMHLYLSSMKFLGCGQTILKHIENGLMNSRILF